MANQKLSKSKGKKRAKSGPKGAAFEAKIATMLRTIYDPAELVQAMTLAAKAKQRKEWSRLLKSSVVRRSEQARGAKEADLVVDPGLCPCWIECQDARDSGHTPLAKYAQAVLDIEDTKSDLLAAAVCHKTGEKKIGVWMSLQDLVVLAAAQPDGAGIRMGAAFQVGTSEAVESMAQPVRLDLGDWLWLLRCWKERADG